MDNNRKDMKDKYYTPSIEEFRIGFKCETRREDRRPGVRYHDVSLYEWRPFVMSMSYFNDDEIDIEIRCKYLCKEDILSLGFIKINEYKSSKEYTLKNCYLQLWSNGDVLIWTKGDMNTLFSGQVKNINELEVILKQVGG